MNEVFRSLIHPVEPEAFAARWRDRSPLHVERKHTGHFADLLDTAQLERLLSERALHFPDVQLSRAEQPIDAADYTDAANRIVPARLLRLHAEGGTIVLARAQHHVPALASLCRNLQRELGVRCQANVYLSPAGQQGFGPHYDAHDVFILQVAGRKRFAFYEGGPPLPLSSQPFEPSAWPAGDRRETRLIEAGSTLYIPRGVLHDAMADASSPSLHVTLGTFAPTAFDVLHTALQRCAERDVGVRQALHADNGAALAEVAGLLDTLLDAPMLADALRALRDEVALSTVPDVQGLCARLADEHDEMAPQGLSLLPTEPWHAEWINETLRLRCTGAVLSFEGAPAAAVAVLLEQRSVNLHDWSMLDAAQQRALAQRLIGVGVARRDGAPG